ncbi:hypothetical protein, conserved [Angomonas deanei]|uniref:Uncharacterized protein n=1 Tax=Angomonas deanei TaxID=59799 RepID=A0A7G2CH76_9TRYP|nr:hypothetical protein, conserved [Angomonas deanei]
MESVSINGFVYRIPFPIYIYLLYSTLHTSQTKMEKAQALFDKCAPLLEEAAFSTWKRSEVEMFFQVLAEYHQASAMAEEEEEAEDVAESHYKTTVAEVDRFLVKVKGFLNEKYPFGSIEEPTRVPNSGEVSATAAPVVSVDAFLYDEEDVQQLIEKGQLSDRYCLECGSMKTGLTEFITHSFSRDQLVFIVCYVLPYLRNELQCDVSKLVEVGARFGNLLWACFAAAEERQTVVKEVVGVELDQKMVDVQRALLTRFCSRPKPTNPLTCRIVHSDCFEGEGKAALTGGDVLVLHNVFQYFVQTPADHVRCWTTLRETANRPGQILLCSPPIEETLSGVDEGVIRQHLKTKKRPREETPIGEVIQQWLEEYVECITIDEVRDTFLQLRTAELGCGEDCGDGCCEHEENSVAEDLREGVQNIAVYRVK